MTVEIVLFHSELTIALQSSIPEIPVQLHGMDLTRLASGSHALREKMSHASRGRHSPYYCPCSNARLRRRGLFCIPRGCFSQIDFFFGVKKQCNYSLIAIIYLRKSLLTLQFLVLINRAKSVCMGES